MSRSTHTQKLPNHRLTNAAKHLHHCMLVNQLQCTTHSASSGSLPLWYVSCQKTATMCAPVMAWSTAIQDDTFMNTVSSLLTLPQLSHQPFCRLLPYLAFLQQCLHPPSLHYYCILYLLHLQHLQLQNHRHQLSLKLPLCHTYVCDTQHSPCAAL